MTGEVISVSKTGYHVNVNGKTVFCLINNSFKSDEKPIVGDLIVAEQREDKYFILDIKTRRSLLRRFDETKQCYQHIAANVDTVFIVTSANREFSENRIKKFLALCDGQQIRCVIVLTKTDQNKTQCTTYNDLCKRLGTEWIGINALKKDEVKKLLNYWQCGETALLMGSSGVGKSTIINTLCGLNLKTQGIQGARRLNQGRHTTSARTMYFLECGRKIIDNPGVRIVGTVQQIS